MRNASEGYRAFLPEFVSYMQARGGPPREKSTRAWFRKRMIGVKNEHLSDARMGRYAPAKYVTGIVEMILVDREHPEVRQSFVALVDFLEGRGFHAYATSDLDAVLSHVCSAVAEAPPKRGETSGRIADFIERSASAVLQLPIRHLLEHKIRGCRPDSDDVAACVRMIYLHLGRMLEPAGPTSGAEAATLRAEKAVGIGLREYAKRAAAWHRVNPWTVVRAMLRDECVGTSIVLPLTQAAYDDVLNERRASCELGPADLRVPSNRLLIEARAEDFVKAATSRIGTARSIQVCLALQLAALMRYRRGESPSEFRWLSFAGSPDARLMLLQAGFKSTGRRMKPSGIEIVERVVDMDAGDTTPLIEAYFLETGGRACPPAPRIAEREKDAGA